MFLFIIIKVNYWILKSIDKKNQKKIKQLIVLKYLIIKASLIRQRQ